MLHPGTWVGMAALVVLSGCGSSNGPRVTSARVDHESPAATPSPDGLPVPTAGEPVSAFELVGNAQGVFRYDALTGEVARACEGSAEQLYRLDDARVLFVDSAAMTLRICNVQAG